MIAVATIAFALLVVAWLLAPKSPVRAETPKPAANLKMSDARA
jgi:hypothetical protein